MSAYSNTFQLTITSSGLTFDLAAGQLVAVIAEGSGSKIWFESNGAINSPVVVNETPTAIATASQMIFPITISGGTIYLNANRVDSVTDNPTTSKGDVHYFDPQSSILRIYEATETRAQIRVLIAAIVGSGGGSVVTGLTAHPGGGQTNATQLSYGYNEVTTVVTAGDSVKLPVAQSGAKVTVLNDGSNAMDVFPATGDTINDGSANAAISLAPGVSMTFTAINSTNWETGAQTIETNSLKELTAGAGITVQSRMLFADVNTYSNATGITAFATGGQASATALTKEYNNVTVVATSGDSVKLLAAVAGLRQIIKNNGASNLDVFPNTGDTIDGGAANAAISMAPGTTRIFSAIDATDWESSQAIVINGTVFSLTTGITAFATGGQGGATALTTYFNNVTTVATDDDSVKLLPAAAGTIQVVANNGVSRLEIFPNTGDTINGGAANAGILLEAGCQMTFAAVDSTNWITAINQAVSTIVPIVKANGVVVNGITFPDGGAVRNSLLATNAKWASFYPEGAPENITAGTGGAISVVTYMTTINTDAGGDAYTLANGTQLGQLKEIYLLADGGGDGVVTVATLTGGTTITLDDAGDYVLLQWNGAGVGGSWQVIKNIGCTIA